MHHGLVILPYMVLAAIYGTAFPRFLVFVTLVLLICGSFAVWTTYISLFKCSYNNNYYLLKIFQEF